MAIGRAITRSPDVFLFDEPLSNLDAALRRRCASSSAAAFRAQGDDDLRDARPDRSHDDGRAGLSSSTTAASSRSARRSPYNNPENRFVAGFLGSPRMNFVAAKVATVSGRTRLLRGARLRADGA